MITIINKVDRKHDVVIPPEKHAPTIRDHFAAAALVGLCQDIIPERSVPGSNETEIQITVSRAFAIADECMRQRQLSPNE